LLTEPATYFIHNTRKSYFKLMLAYD